MAIYRPPKPRWPLAAATAGAGIVLGLVAGLLVGTDEIDPTEAARDLRASLIRAAGSLEVAAVEYDEALSNGTVDNKAEYEGALDAVASSRRIFGEVRPGLGTLAPDLVTEIDVLYDDVERAMRTRTDPSEVAAMLAELEELLKGPAP